MRRLHLRVGNKAHNEHYDVQPSNTLCNSKISLKLLTATFWLSSGNIDFFMITCVVSNWIKKIIAYIVLHKNWCHFANLSMSCSFFMAYLSCYSKISVTCFMYVDSLLLLVEKKTLLATEKKRISENDNLTVSMLYR